MYYTPPAANMQELLSLLCKNCIFAKTILNKRSKFLAFSHLGKKGREQYNEGCKEALHTEWRSMKKKT